MLLLKIQRRCLDSSVLRDGGKLEKTAGPALRGAAKNRTLQEGLGLCCGLAVSQEPHNPGGTDMDTTPSARRSVTARGIERKGTGVQCACAWGTRCTRTPSESGVGGGGPRSCSRTMSWLLITTTLSPSFLRLASEQLVACAHHRKTLQAEDRPRLSGGTMSPGWAHAIRVKSCHPCQIGAHRERVEIWAL